MSKSTSALSKDGPRAEDIKQVILSEDDFGHEMRVGKVIETQINRGSTDAFVNSFQHGGTYVDSVTRKPRQLTIVAKSVGQIVLK